MKHKEMGNIIHKFYSHLLNCQSLNDEYSLFSASSLEITKHLDSV